MEQLKTEHYLAIKRPLGVWFLTIYAAIFAGISPLVLSVGMLGSGGLGTNSVILIISMLLNASIIYYSFRTWQGNDRARKTFMILVTMNYLLIAVNNISFLLSGQLTSDDQTILFGRILRGVLYPAIYIWYFNRSTTKLFYDTGK